MQRKLNEILKKIEELRKKINNMLEIKEATDPEVITASQMLDSILNEYESILKRKQKDK